uniref:CSON004916 protein n=1 Tax=Culicoides sonorensis TaxID=179676 RepID=A0A336MS49_CULSO
MEIDIKNLKESCRLCLEIPKNELISLNHKTFNEMIEALIGIDNDASKSLKDTSIEPPSNICRFCFEKLRGAYEFQQKILSSQRNLIKLIEKYSNQLNSSDIESDEIIYEPCMTGDEKSEIKNEPQMEDLSEDESISYEPCTNFDINEISTTSDDASMGSRHLKPIIDKQNNIKISRLSKYECGLCDKVYSDLKAFRIHFRKHSGERPFLCSYCSQTFADKSGLDKHVKRKHTEEGFNKHQCPYCPHKACDVTHLRTHIQTHTGEKPDICQICGKSFNGKTGLRMHLKTHVNERNFKCRFCERAFKLKKYKERHELIHQNIKPYQCHYCGSSFTQRADMVKHLKQHNHDTSYKCDQCNSSFRLKIELRRHMVAHPRHEISS